MTPSVTEMAAKHPVLCFQRGRCNEELAFAVPTASVILRLDFFLPLAASHPKTGRVQKYTSWLVNPWCRTGWSFHTEEEDGRHGAQVRRTTPR